MLGLSVLALVSVRLVARLVGGAAPAIQPEPEVNQRGQILTSGIKERTVQAQVSIQRLNQRGQILTSDIKERTVRVLVSKQRLKTQKLIQF